MRFWLALAFFTRDSLPGLRALWMYSVESVCVCACVEMDVFC